MCVCVCKLGGGRKSYQVLQEERGDRNGMEIKSSFYVCLSCLSFCVCLSKLSKMVKHQLVKASKRIIFASLLSFIIAT